jgi:hypothetical protein
MRRVALEVSAPKLAHLHLSEAYRVDRLVIRRNAADVFAALVTELQAKCDDVPIEADLYYSKYRLR